MLMPLAVLSNLFGSGDLDAIAHAGGLSRVELEAGVKAVGAPLRRLPEQALPWFESSVRPQSVPGTDPVEYEALVPLWTDTGMAGRAARVRLVPSGFESTFRRHVIGFEDVVPPPEVTGMVPDPARQPRPPEVRLTEPLVPMEHPVPEGWRPLIRRVVDRLAAGDYEGLEREGVITHVGGPGDMVRSNLKAYHDSLVPLPPQAWAWSDHLPVYAGPGVYHVTLPLWTAVEGVSDLTLTAEVHDDGTSVRVVVTSVHVL